jgi:hypothetical protein
MLKKIDANKGPAVKKYFKPYLSEKYPKNG